MPRASSRCSAAPPRPRCTRVRRSPHRVAERARNERAVSVRRATVSDVPGVAAVMARYVEEGTLLPRSIGELYRSVPEFNVAVDDQGKVVACAALRILWS